MVLPELPRNRLGEIDYDKLPEPELSTPLADAPVVMRRSLRPTAAVM